MSTPETTPDKDARQRIVIGRLQWWLMLYAGVVLPIACVLMSEMALIGNARWQDGSLSALYGPMLLPSISWPLYLSLLYSCVCLVVFLSGSTRWQTDWRVQLGIATGTLVSFTFGIIFPIAIGTNPFVYWGTCLVGTLAGYAGLRALIWALPRIYRLVRWTLWGKCVAILLVFAIAYLVARDSEMIFSLPFFCFFVSFLAATVWCFMVFAYCTWLFVRNAKGWQVGLLPMIAALTWFAGFMAALRWSVLKAFAHYESLPTTRPTDCYIATAAARGHVGLVKAVLLIDSQGNEFWVNQQLIRLKAAELLLKTITPQFHRLLRRVYDRWGPILAERISNPILADLSYLLLRPLDVIAWWAVRVVGGKDAIAALPRIYTAARLKKA